MKACSTTEDRCQRAPDSAARRRRAVAAAVVDAIAAEGSGRSALFEGLGQTDCGQERAGDVGLARVSGGGAPTGDVAHVPTDVFFVGASEGRATVDVHRRLTISVR
jgi:hypothetical protein